MSRQLRRQAADIAAAEYRWLVALEEFDRDGGFALEGAKTTVGWLSWACGVSGQAARERVRVARALPGLPLISAQFAQGGLSFSKARAITRVATPENEATQPLLAPESVQPPDETVGCDTRTGGSTGSLRRVVAALSATGPLPAGERPHRGNPGGSIPRGRKCRERNPPL